MKSKVEKILYIVIALSTLVALGFALAGKTDALGSAGLYAFRFYTTDSNIIALFSSLLSIFYLFTNKKWPHLMTIYQFVSTVTVTITFLVVCVFLAPTVAIKNGNLLAAFTLFEGTGFVLHFTTPVLSIVALLLTKRTDFIAKKELIWSLLPVLVYSVIYFICVVCFKVWPDFYGFTFGGHYWVAPIDMLVMYAVVMAVAFIEWRLVLKLNHSLEEE